MSIVCRSASSASVPEISRVCCISSTFLRGWIGTWGNTGLYGVGVMTWRCASALVLTSGRCCGALDSVESALYLISTSRYNFLSISTATTEVPGFQCMSANNLPRS